MSSSERTRRFPLWTLLGGVVLVALVIGSGVLSSSPPTAAQRATAIESVVRCPTCEDLSVAQSSAPTAVAVRAAVAQQIATGRTDQQIEAYLVDRYGSSIVLDPPASGWSLLVWLLPLVGGLVATAVVVVVLVRRRGPVDGTPSRSGDGVPLDPEAAADRRRFLTQSLADADAEYLAGDLSDQDYLALRQRDLARLAALGSPGSSPSASPAPPDESVRATSERRSPSGSVALDRRATQPEAIVVAGTDRRVAADAGETSAAGGPGTARGRIRLRRNTWFLVIGCSCIAAALIVAVTTFASNRQPGQGITGTFAQTAQQQVQEDLAQAATYENTGRLGQAADLYQSVLTRHPANEVAMAQLGWLEVETGQQGKSASLIADGRSKLDKAVQLDPGDYAARLYLGTLLLTQDGNAVGAVDQYRRFLADGPPASLVGQAASEIRLAYTRAGVPVPAAVAG